MTPELLFAVMPFAGSRAVTFAGYIGSAMDRYSIKSMPQKSAFLAQIAHESGSLKYVKEIADGAAYEGRLDLGNTQPGDGPRYKGRGLIQITGRSNYGLYGPLLGLDLLKEPERLEEPHWACFSAACFWQRNGLNELASGDKFGAITKKINGGYNGLDDRIAHWLRARKALGI